MVIKRWRNTSIIALAMFIPRQVLPPIPKAKNLYGFDSSCWMAKGKKKHFIKLCLLYNIAFWKILNPLFTLMENWEKDWFCHRETYIKPLWTKFIGVIVHHRIKVYWSSINVYVPPSLDLKSYNDQYIAWNKKLQSLLHQFVLRNTRR